MQQLERYTSCNDQTRKLPPVLPAMIQHPSMDEVISSSSGQISSTLPLSLLELALSPNLYPDPFEAAMQVTEPVDVSPPSPPPLLLAPPAPQ
jgi:hypothetical protein